MLLYIINIKFCKAASNRGLFSYCAITFGSGQNVQKKKNSSNIDSSLDNSQLDKGEVTLSNVLVAKERQERVKCSLKVQCATFSGIL